MLTLRLRVRSSLRLLVPILGSAAAPIAFAQKGGAKPVVTAPIVWYEADIASAQVEATERNVPILVFSIKEAEDENDRFRDDVLAEKQIPALVERAVLLLVNDGEHPPRVVEEKVEDGTTRGRRYCSVYGTEGCDGHRRNWDRVYLDYGAVGSPDGGWKLPEVFVLKPNGALHERHNEGNPPRMEPILASFEKAVKEAGEGISKPELDTVKAALEQGERAIKARQWQQAWRAYSSVLAITTATRWAERARAESEVVVTALRGELDALVPLLTAEKITESYPALVRLGRECEGTPVAKEVKTHVDRVEKDKALKETIAPLKVELEAESLWEEYDALKRAGDEAKARAVLKKLRGAKYAETKAGKRARETDGG